MKTDTLPAEVKSYVDYAVQAAYTIAQKVLSVQANHAFANNTSTLSIGSGAAQTIVQVTGLTSDGYRLEPLICPPNQGETP